MSEILNNDDVVSMDANRSFAKTETSQIVQLKQALQQLIPAGNEWLSSGVHCKVLKTSGGGWQTGMLRLQLEFIPDKPLPSSPDEVS